MSTGLRIDVLTTYPRSDASRRLRIDPLVEALTELDASVRVHTLMSERTFRKKNSGVIGRSAGAVALLFRCLARLAVVLRPRDVLIVHREALPFFTPYFERLAVARSRLSVLDVDDAIFETPTHGSDWRRWLRDPSRALEYSRVFDVILAGNDRVAGAYRGAKSEVVYAPTCPPDQVSQFATKRSSTDVHLLWTGSQSTLPSLAAVLPEVLRACVEENATLHILGGQNVLAVPRHPALRAGLWSEERELELLQLAQIGLMPLPDSPWEEGKSGYKAILYLCSGLRALISPVGENNKLLQQFRSAVRCEPDEWYGKVVQEIRRVRATGLDEAEAREARRVFDSRSRSADVARGLISRLDEL